MTGRLDVDKIYSTLKQVVREWGEHGRKEREQSYGVVIREILVLLGAHKLVYYFDNLPLIKSLSDFE